MDTKKRTICFFLVVTLPTLLRISLVGQSREVSATLTILIFFRKKNKTKKKIKKKAVSDIIKPSLNISKNSFFLLSLEEEKSSSLEVVTFFPGDH